MRIVIMGAGGLGGYFGARLAAAGNDVAFVARGAHLAAIREHGLRVESALGDLHLRDVVATDDPATLAPADVVMIAVKLWDTEAAAEAVKPLVRPGTAVVSFQNGVSKDEVLTRILGPRGGDRRRRSDRRGDRQPRRDPPHRHDGEADLR